MKNRTRFILERRTFAACACCFTFATAQPDIITQRVADIDWNAAMWGDPAAPPTTGNDYVGNPALPRLRMAASGASSVFLGDSLTLVSGSRALIKLQNGATATVNGDLTLDGGGLSYGPNGGPHDGILDVNNFIVTGTGSDITPSGAVSTFTIDGTLTGSGDLALLVVSGDAFRTVTFTDVMDYTGNLTVADLIQLDFNADHEFSGTLTLQGGARLNVDQTLTFIGGNLTANGVVIEPGTYSGSDLGPNFVGGGGMLIVSDFPDSDNDGLPDFYEDMIIAFADDLVDGYEDIA